MITQGMSGLSQTQKLSHGDFNDRVDDSPGSSTPGRVLMCELIEQAITDLRSNRFLDGIQQLASKASRIERKQRQLGYITAHLWLASTRSDYDTAFERLGETLDLPVSKIRRALGVHPGDSFFGWKELSEEDLTLY